MRKYRITVIFINSDLIPKGEADLIISMEPMEALRYVGFLNADGRVVSSSAPFVNIPNYPSIDAVLAELRALTHVSLLDIDAMAREHQIPKSANMILLGMAAPAISILTPESLRQAISTVFARKGDAIVEANQKAFDLGYNAVKS